jgi:hypothetical protein
LIVPAALLVESCLKNRASANGIYLCDSTHLSSLGMLMDGSQSGLSNHRARHGRSLVYQFFELAIHVLPYPQTIQKLKEITTPGDVIYAPMINEPVHFYLAKYDLRDRIYRRSCGINWNAYRWIRFSIIANKSKPMVGNSPRPLALYCQCRSYLE